MRAFLQIAVLAPVLVASFAIPPSSDSEVKGGWTDQDSQVSPPVLLPVIVHVEAVKGTSGRDALECNFTDAEDSHGFTVDDDLVELEYLQAQLEELKYLILEKKRAIAQRTGNYDQAIVECDSLVCIARSIGGKVRKAVYQITAKVEGDPVDEKSIHHPKPHWPRPPFHHGKPGNHTCGPPHHGNRTHPPPHFRKPHLHLPFCHYPPPPHHDPHHKPPPGHKQPDEHPPPHDPEHKLPPGHRKPDDHPPPHEPEHTPPPGHRKPDDHPPPREPEHKPPPGHRRPDDHPPSHDPEHKPPPHHRPDEHSPPHGEPDDDFSHPHPDHRGNQEPIQLSNDDVAFPPPRPFHHQSPPEGHRYHRISPNGAQVGILGLIVFLLMVLLKSLHNLRNPVPKESRRAQRPHRHSLRRAAHRQSVHSLLRRLGYIAPAQQDDEKRAALLPDSDSISTTMTEDIAGFRNAADLVSDMIAAEEGRGMSMYVDGEEGLPTYEELGSVSDGCRFTPGSSDYSPSLAGSAGDILGDDSKQ